MTNSNLYNSLVEYDAAVRAGRYTEDIVLGIYCDEAGRRIRLETEAGSVSMTAPVEAGEIRFNAGEILCPRAEDGEYQFLVENFLSYLGEDLTDIRVFCREAEDSPWRELTKVS